MLDGARGEHGSGFAAVVRETAGGAAGRAAGEGVAVLVKAVPGSSRDVIAGVLAMPEGARLKIRVSAPAESGRANEAILGVLSGALGVARRACAIESGLTNPLKTVRVEGLTAAEARRKLAGE